MLTIECAGFRIVILATVCRKPTSDQIAKRAMVICKAEGLTVNETTLNTVAAGANGDIRLVLGQLQMIRLRSKTLSYDDAKVLAPSQQLQLDGCRARVNEARISTWKLLDSIYMILCKWRSCLRGTASLLLSCHSPFVYAPAS